MISTVLSVLPVVTLVILGYQRRWTTEDAFISFRVADQILAGNGPVFNTGERVEAQTNVLWVAILAAFGLVGINLAQAAMVLGLFFSALGLLAGIQATRHRSFLASGDVGATPSIFLPFGALVLVALPVVWDFSTSGLETGLTLGWLGTSYWALVRSSDCSDQSTSTPLVAAAVIGLGPLIRPDLAIHSAGFLMALLFLRARANSARAWRNLMLLVAAAAFAPVAYQIFRMGYYAALVPNTAYAKEASSSHWSQGWLYLLDFVAPYKLWAPLALVFGYLAAVATVRFARHDWVGTVLLITPILTGTLHALYVVRVGGDFMHGRLLLPALFALLLPLLVIEVPVGRRPRLLGSSMMVLLVLGWSIVAATSLRPPYGAEIDEETQIIDERAYYTADAGHSNPVTIDDYASVNYRWVVASEVVHYWNRRTQRTLWIDDQALPLATSVTDSIRFAVTRHNIGIFGHVAGATVHVIDLNGLADPIGARMELAERGRPGHEKELPIVWVKARFAQSDLQITDDPSVILARQALECGELGQLINAVTEPLTPKRFLANIVLSVRLHDVRIPPDPKTAIERFCAPT